MKRILIICLMSMFILMSNATEREFIVVYMVDGTTIEVPLQEMPVVKIADGKLKITTAMSKLENPTCAHVEMAMGSIGNYTLFFFNALLMSIALIGLSMLIDKWLKNKVLLLYIGQNTLILLCVHAVLLLGVSKMFSLMGFEYEGAEMMILKGIITYVIVIIASIPVIVIIRRFIPNMVGQ